MSSIKKNIIVIGAGLTGLLLSIYLARRGYKVTIYERRDDLRFNLKPYNLGRSMSLDLSKRGIFALSEIGLEEEVLKITVPMKHRILHSINGELTSITYGRNEEEYINAVSRSQLHKILLNAAQAYSSIEIYFNQCFIDMNIDSGKMIFKDEITQQKYEVLFNDLVIGCDGAYSKVRRVLESNTEIQFNKHYLQQHYKGLTIPLTDGQQIEKNAMHMWPRGEFMLVAQPNYDGSFICALLLSDKGNDSFATLTTPAKIQNFFQTYFPDVYHLIPNLVDEFIKNPMGELITIRDGIWTLNNKLLLLGDSIHAMVPFFGQGVNCCFEDCTILNQYLDKYNDNWQEMLPAFEFERKKNTNAISTMSLENYPELNKSDTVSTSILKREIDELIRKKFHEFYISYHNLVCFERVSYFYANTCKKLQQGLLDKLSEGIDHISKLDWKKVSLEVQKYKTALDNIKIT